MSLLYTGLLPPKKSSFPIEVFLFEDIKEDNILHVITLVVSFYFLKLQT